MKVILSVLVVFIVLFLFSQKVFAQKRYTTFEIEAPQLKTTKKIWIYLPLNYEKSTKKYKGGHIRASHV